MQSTATRAITSATDWIGCYRVRTRGEAAERESGFAKPVVIMLDSVHAVSPRRDSTTRVARVLVRLVRWAPATTLDSLRGELADVGSGGTWRPFGTDSAVIFSGIEPGGRWLVLTPSAITGPVAGYTHWISDVVGPDPRPPVVPLLGSKVDCNGVRRSFEESL